MPFSANRILSVVLMALGLSPAVFSQAVVLDDFATMRRTFDNWTTLWQVANGQCNRQEGGAPGVIPITTPVSSNRVNVSIAGCDGMTCTQTGGDDPNNACLYLFFHGLGQYNAWGYTAGVGNGAWVQNYIKSGTWSPTLNRLKFDISCTRDYDLESVGQVGSYIRAHDDTNEGNQGQHYYWQTRLAVAGNRRTTVVLSDMVDHRVSAPGSIIFPRNPEFSGLQTNMGTPVRTMDGLTRFYIFPWYWVGADGVGDRQCSVGPVTLYQQDGEPTEYVHTLTGRYDGTNQLYEVVFNGPGRSDFSYEVRYSTSGSLKTLGFSNGTSGGAANAQYADAPYNIWHSPNMAEATNNWVGIRPHINVMGAANTSPILLSTRADTMISTGDQVTVSGVSGNTAANGTWTVNWVDRKYWRYDTGSLAGMVASGGELTVTTTSPHGLVAGQLVAFVGLPGNTGYGLDYLVDSVSNPTQFTVAVGTAVADGNYTAPTVPGFEAIISDPVLSLRGSTGNGAYTGGGQIVATSNTTNFTELQLTAGSSQGLSPCDVNGDGVVDRKDVTAAINAALGIVPCTADLNGDGVCNVVDVQRVIDAANGGLCRGPGQ